MPAGTFGAGGTKIEIAMVFARRKPGDFCLWQKILRSCLGCAARERWTNCDVAASSAPWLLSHACPPAGGGATEHPARGRNDVAVARFRPGGLRHRRPALRRDRAKDTGARPAMGLADGIFRRGTAGRPG